MCNTTEKKHKGISLLETVTAATILATAVMTVCGLSAKGLRSVRLNQEQEKAWDYLDRQLVLIDTSGVATLAEAGTASGEIESFDGRLWRWTAEAAETELTGLYDVKVQVEWLSNKRLKQVTCCTRLCGQPAALDETNTLSQGTAE
jgi:hypothetical protein